MKSSPSSNLVENPFIKEKNKSWEVKIPSSYSARVSPPPPSKRLKLDSTLVKGDPSTSAVEAGKVDIQDHLKFFSEKLSKAARLIIPGIPRLAHKDWIGLYNRNQHPHGHHFVIHQHDHPIAGTHYDLRLQCNQTSSISFAIMYGLPGDPNSRRLNRNATETRVHNLWNHLIETASHSTGSMLIWDTGEYSVLPSLRSGRHPETDESEEEEDKDHDRLTESEKLAAAFSQRKIRLRLHGTRLPQGYTIYLRLPKRNFKSSQPKPPTRRRRRPDPQKQKQQKQTETSSDTDSSSDTIAAEREGRNLASLIRTASPPPKSNDDNEEAVAMASEDETEVIRLHNAYTGATNNVGSVHQRKWYLSLDREHCGFTPRSSMDGNGKTHKQWVRRRGSNGHLLGFDRFVVMGRDGERSVVTGRLAKDVLHDEGVEGYVPRGLWRPVTE